MTKKSYPITKILIAINIIVMLIVLAVNYKTTNDYNLTLQTLVSFGAIVPQQSSILTIISAMFLHGGIAHIIINMISLKTLGKGMENAFSYFYLPLYLISGIISGLAVYYFGHNPTVGASGAICGLLGANLVYVFKYKSEKIEKIAAVSDIIILIAIGFIPIVSAIGHMGGLISGIVIALVFFSFKKPELTAVMPTNLEKEKSLIIRV